MAFWGRAIARLLNLNCRKAIWPLHRSHFRPKLAAPPEGAEDPDAESVVADEPDQPAESYDRRKTADELAAIILKALQTLDGAPASGFVVTVYGGNPWNAMLTIKPEAGPIADPGLWRARVRDMAARLRQDFDVAEV